MRDFSQYPIVFAGDSHVSCIAGWDTADPAQLINIKKIPSLYSLRGSWPRQRDYFEKLVYIAKASPDLRPVFLLRGNDHLAAFLLQPDQPIDFFSSKFPELPVDTNCRIVPEELIDGYFSSLIEPMRSVLYDISHFGGRFISVATPPPKGDDEFLRSVLGNESYFCEALACKGLSIGDVTFTSPATRLKLWGAVCRANERLTNEAGGTFIPPPPGAFNSSGFLDDKYFEPDCTHANSAYGELMIDYLNDFLAGSEK